MKPCSTLNNSYARRTAISYANGATATFDYDLNDNVVSMQDRKGQITNVPASGGYDALDRITRIDYDDDSYTTLSYDAASRITQVSDSASGDIDFTYTNTSQGEYPDRVALVNSPQGDISYTYDDLGRRTGMSAAGKTVSYTYNTAGLLNSVSLDSPSMTFTFSYDDAGRRMGINYPNRITATYIYNLVDGRAGKKYGPTECVKP